MAIDFSNITLEVIDINSNATPDMFINQNRVTFSKRVLEDLNYPPYIQYCLDPGQNIFAIRSCKGSEAKATPFSKPRGEQTTTLICNNKNLLDVIRSMIPNADPKKRFKIVGQFDPESKTIYYEMASAEVNTYRGNRENVPE